MSSGTPTRSVTPCGRRNTRASRLRSRLAAHSCANSDNDEIAVPCNLVRFRPTCSRPDSFAKARFFSSCDGTRRRFGRVLLSDCDENVTPEDGVGVNEEGRCSWASLTTTCSENLPGFVRALKTLDVSQRFLGVGVCDTLESRSSSVCSPCWAGSSAVASCTN